MGSGSIRQGHTHKQRVERDIGHNGTLNWGVVRSQTAGKGVVMHLWEKERRLVYAFSVERNLETFSILFAACSVCLPSGRRLLVR